MRDLGILLELLKSMEYNVDEIKFGDAIALLTDIKTVINERMN